MQKLVISLKTIIIVSLIVSFIAGYFVGREHIRYTLTKTLKEAFIPSREIDLEDKPKISGAEKAKIEQDKRDYLQYIKIYDLEYYESRTFGTINRRIKGKLQNIGNRPLKEVVINFTFLDKDMKPIFEDIVNGYIFKDMKRHPIKPNYITDIYYSGDDVPDEWSGKFEYKIADIIFWEEK